MRNKERAEFEFDVDAKPVSLGVKFDQFCEFNLQEEVFVQDADSVTYYDLYSDEISDLPVDSTSLVLLANDLDPQQRDIFENQLSSLTEDDDLNTDFNEFKESFDMNNSLESVETVDFKIKHSDFKQQINEFIPDNKIVTAFRLVSLAMDKLDEKAINSFGLQHHQQDREYHEKLALIDKSVNSIRFINLTGKKVLNYVINKFPDKFRFSSNDDDAIIEWLNEKSNIHNLDHVLLFSAFICSKMTFSNIEINDHPALNFRISGEYLHLSSHQILRFMEFQTINVSSVRFKNLKKYIFGFSVVHKGSRLYYLEKLISDAEKGLVFFQSHENNFSEREGSFSNEIFPYYNVYAFKNLIRRIPDLPSH